MPARRSISPTSGSFPPTRRSSPTRTRSTSGCGSSARCCTTRRAAYICLTRFADVHAALRDRRLGREFRHRYTPQEFGRPPDDDRWPRWQESEQWSLLNLEPPDHTRLRRLVSAVFTARSVAALRPQISTAL